MYSQSHIATSKHSIPKLHSIDKQVDHILLSQVLPTTDIMAAYDATRDQSRFSKVLLAPNIFDRPLRPSDVTEYIKDGVQCAELNRGVAAKLWDGTSSTTTWPQLIINLLAIMTMSQYVVCAAQYKSARSLRELRPIIPVDHLTSIGAPFPSIVLLQRHSGENPFFVNKDMSLDDIVSLHDRLQYIGKITLCWIDFTANQCIYRDSFRRWGWTHWESIQPMRKKDTSLRKLLRAIGSYTNAATNAYFAGDRRLCGYEAEFDYSPNGHGKLGALQALCGAAPENPANPTPSCIQCGNPCRDMILHPGQSAYCRAHPTFDPYIPSTNLHEYIDASYDNTEALLPPPPPASPVAGAVDVHCLAGYARREQHHAFVPRDLPAETQDVEMVDVSATNNDGTTDVTDEEMAAWMARIRLNERDAIREYVENDARRYLERK
ncbi:hypothetical protein FB451DRAFT_1169607 [Mycena latifolia]|nr:hypothetical protein FB451DRAFT_1169607 [Mycena latifolia]